MKATLRPVIDSLDSLFDRLNNHFFEGELDNPVITVSPDNSTCGALGWCTTWKAWETAENEGFFEINICAESLNRPAEEIAETMLHEMVHLYNIKVGVKDCSRGGAYHNKKFKSECEKRGLDVNATEKYGWAITKLNEGAKAYVMSLNLESFGMRRTKMVKAKRAGSKSSSRKYICPICGAIVRTTKEMKVLCGECSTEGYLVELELEE